MFSEQSPSCITVSSEEGVRGLEGYLRTSRRHRVLAVTSFMGGESEDPVDPRALSEKFKIDVAFLTDASLVRSLSLRMPAAYRLELNDVRFFPTLGVVTDGKTPSWKAFYNASSPGQYLPQVERMAGCFKRMDAGTARAERARARVPIDAASEVHASPRLSLASANTIEDTVGLEALVELLLDDSRNLPVLVVTRPRGAEGRALVDVARMAEELRGHAYVVELVSAALTWSFAARFPQGSVYNGAMRLFLTPGRAAESGEGMAPERYLYRMFDAQDASDSARRAVADVFGLTAEFAGSEDSDQAPVEADAEVIGLSAGRAICSWEGGFCSATVDEVERVTGLPNVAPERVFCAKMRLRGTVDRKKGLLTGYSEGALVSASDAVHGYASGQTVLACVAAASDDCCEVDLFPGVRVRVAAADVAGQNIRPLDVLSVGQTVAVLVVERGVGSEGWLLSILEAGDEAVLAPSLLVGGPPWLFSEDVRTIETPLERSTRNAEELERSYGEDAALRALDVEVANDAGPAATQQILGLSAQLFSSEDEVASLRKELERTRIALTATRRHLMASKRCERETSSYRQAEGSKRYVGPDLEFRSEEERRDFEVLRMEYLLRKAWLTQTKPGDREREALPDRWSFGEGFFDTLEEANVPLNKVLRCMVDVLLGNGYRRDAHFLRSGEGGDNPPRLGPNGEKLWRCAIEKGVPQAARLHYMVGVGGVITFLSVRRHDDFRS